MNYLRGLSLVLLFALAALPSLVYSQSSIISLDTNGTIYEIAVASGAMTQKGGEVLQNFTLGGSTADKKTFYYIAVPSGSSENALYSFALKSAVLTKIDLDRNDSPRALFLEGKKLFGVFYDGNAGTAGIYKIDPSNGVTTLSIDLSSLDLEPIGGAITRIGKFYYMLAKPETNSALRKLVRFKSKGTVQVIDVVDNSGASVLCNKLQATSKLNGFLCLAANADESALSACTLSLKGKALCSSSLSDITRVGSGHTLVSADGRTFYAMVYHVGETNNQRLLKLNSKGVVKGDIPLTTILIAAHFPTMQTKAKKE